MEMGKVGEPCCHNSSFEARRLCPCPSCHETAIATTRDGNSIAVHHTALDQVFDAIQDILQVFATHIAHNRIGEGYPPPPASAHVGSQHGITGRGHLLGAEEAITKIIAPVPRWTTMSVDNQRGWSFAFVRKRRRKKCIDLPAIHAFIPDDLTWN